MEQQNLDWITSTLLADRGARVLSARVKPLREGWRIFGRALTVSVPQGDNLAIHAALSLAAAGEVLVVSGGNYQERALMGGIMCSQADALQLAGVVIDGAIRDVAELCAGRLPVFASGVCPAGPTKNGAGSVLRPIVCGDVTVNPGDWIFGDQDGVVVFSEQERTALLVAAIQKLHEENSRMQAIARGDLTPAWLSSALDQSDVDIGERARL